jgi:uncharacterized protein YndB with AHSA1/START domain
VTENSRLSLFAANRGVLVSEIRIVRDYPHPAEKVWRALTDPALITLWTSAGAGGRPEGFTPVPGTRFRFVAKPKPGWNGIVDCEVLEADEPRLLRYSWADGNGGGDVTQVAYRLEPRAGGTRFTLHRLAGRTWPVTDVDHAPGARLPSASGTGGGVSSRAMDAFSSTVWGTPRPTTTGRAAAVCPIKIDAAEAISSTRFIIGLLALPNRSASPAGSSACRMPAIPIAAPIAPSRTGLPKESDTITATEAPVSSWSPARMLRADASGSTGRRTA